jgi:hypothetical protein
MQTVLGASKQHQAILLHEAAAAEKRMNNDGGIMPVSVDRVPREATSHPLVIAFTE